MQSLKRLPPEDLTLIGLAVIPMLIPAYFVFGYQSDAVKNHPILSTGIWQAWLAPVMVIAISGMVAFGIRSLMQKPKFEAQVGRTALRVFAVSWTMIYTYGALLSTAMALSPYPPIETLAQLTYRVQMIGMSLLTTALLGSAVAAAFAATMKFLAFAFIVAKSKLAPEAQN